MSKNSKELRGSRHKNGPAKRSLRLIVGLALPLLFGGLIYRYVAAHLDEFSSLWREPLSPWIVGGMAASFLLNLLANGELTRRALTAYGVRLGFRESAALISAASAANYVAPFKGGVGIRAVYLKRRHGLSLANFTAQFTAVGVMTIALAAVFGLGGLALTALAGRPASPLLTAYFGLAAAASWGLLVGLGRLPVHLEKHPRIAALFLGWRAIGAQKGLLGRLAAWQVFFLLTITVFNWLGLRAFEARLSFGQALLYTGGQIHLMAINLTPGGLGVQEAYSVYLGGLLNFTPAQALMAQALARAVSLSILTAAGLWGAFSLRGEFAPEVKNSAGA